MSIGLRGSYREILPNLCAINRGSDGLGVARNVKVWRAPWIRYFPAGHIHRVIIEPGTSCWTLVFAFRVWRKWGFFTPRGWVNSHTYYKSSRADEAEDC